jgi:hypothetical protein
MIPICHGCAGMTDQAAFLVGRDRRGQAGLRQNLNNIQPRSAPCTPSDHPRVPR